MKDLIEALDSHLTEGKRGSKESRAANKEFVRKIMQRGKRVGIDPEEYPKRPGLEGPFSFKSGWIGYYDPKEGKYYDAGKDMYLSDAETRKLIESVLDEAAAGLTA